VLRIAYARMSAGQRVGYDEHEQRLQHVLARFVPALFSYRLSILRARSAPRGRLSGEAGPALVGS
jgi:hypothetical protein